MNTNERPGSCFEGRHREAGRFKKRHPEAPSFREGRHPEAPRLLRGEGSCAEYFKLGPNCEPDLD
jgi:hypothetical protein